MKLKGQNGLHEKLGGFLKAQRNRAGYTQSEVASRLGYSSPQFVSNFERGLCSPPLRQLKQMVRLYKMDAGKLVNLIISEQESQLKSALLKGDARR